MAWINISDEISDNMFHLADDTGICVIDPEHAHVIAEQDRAWYGSSTADRLSPPESANLIHGLGIGDYRFSKKLIRPATAIYALGLFRTLRHRPSATYLDKQVKILAFATGSIAFLVFTIIINVIAVRPPGQGVYYKSST